MDIERLRLRKLDAWVRWDVVRTNPQAAPEAIERAYAAWYAAWLAYETAWPRAGLSVAVGKPA